MKTKPLFRFRLALLFPPTGRAGVQLMHFASQARKMQVSLTFIFLLLPFVFAFSQAPQGFNYQAVARDNTGQILKGEGLTVKIGIWSETASGTLQWEETHSVTTNDYGIFTIEVGGGVRTGGAASEFADIDWGASSHFLNVQVDNTGSYVDMGTSQLLSVPYALNAGSVTTLKSLNIVENIDHVADSALFEVKNQDGNTVFAVYNEGVRVYVDDDEVKGLKGGFAVGGFSSSKGITNEYLRVTPDSVRIYIDETISKGLKGGFAVGGFSPGKEGSDNLMHLTPDNYFIGHQSGSSITTGMHNSFFGYQSGLLNDIGNRNVFLGYNTGYSNTEGNFNTFIGSNTGYSNTKGLSNVFIGDSSGYDNTIGSYNVFMGNLSGVQNDSGYYNVFIGDSAGYSNVEGNQNIFMGVGSGFSNMSGGHNVFLGVESGRNNTEGTANVFLGDFAGHLNDTGDHNIFIGASCGYNNINGENNIFLGYASGYNNTTAGDNVFIGNWAGYYNKTGTKNVFQGYQAGAYNDTGSYNVFIGNYAGRENTFGNYNTFLGAYSGRYNTEGKSNVAVGKSAGKTNTTGNFNVFLGTLSGTDNTEGEQNTFIGQQSGYQNTTGSYNTAIGDLSGYSNSIGSSNVFLGHYAGYWETGSNKLYIANKSSEALITGDFSEKYVTINGDFRIYDNPGTGLTPLYYAYQGSVTASTGKQFAFAINDALWVATYVWADAYYTNSDKRFKKNIRIIDNSLLKVIGLKGVYYDWEQSYIKGNDEEPTNKKYEHKQEIGFIAQDIEKFLPEVVHTDAAGYKSVEYAKISALLVEAIKEQQKMIEELQERIAVLEEKNE